MVTTGTSGRYNNKSEVIDLMDPTKTCQPWVEYPIGVDSAVGVFIQDKVVICGGDSTFTAGNGAVDRCFALGPSEVTEMTMSAASYSSAAALVPLINPFLYLVDMMVSKLWIGPSIFLLPE